MTVRDREVLLELRDEPELLAIADALADVLEPETSTRRRRRWIPVSAAAATVVVAAAAALALVLAGEGVKGGFVDQALAAVGDAPVLHVVLRQEYAPDEALVEIATGERTQQTKVIETETWFDEERGLRHNLYRANGELTLDELATPEGTTTGTGPVWTCARIARHPVEATRARVSCHLSGENGTVPKDVPEERPTADPGLAAFVDGYREALESGAARRLGEDTVDGRRVEWLEFDLPTMSDADGQNVTRLSEQVAVASDTHLPVLVRRVANGIGGPVVRVTTIESIPRERADFSKPKRAPADSLASGWNVTAKEEIQPWQAASALGGSALWPGPRVAGLELARVERREVTISYPEETGRPPLATTTVAFVYGPGELGGHPTATFDVIESAQPLPGWVGPNRVGAPPEGFMSLNSFGWGLLQKGGLYFQLMSFAVSKDVEQQALAAARQLEPVPRG
jgi:hypothetical protein